ncbi:MAG: DNA polymerase III subunit delta' [Zoogloea sp.]|nr:DNA polymerase III subunit delta' [Zoogloea sp.]
MIYEWQAGLWNEVLALDGRLPHAILLSGPAGGGKRDFAEALAARLLCQRPGQDGHACGVCEACRWRLAGSHPDMMRVVPEADEAAAEPAEGDAKAASRQIRVEQIRDLQASLTVGGHRGGERVIVLDPAEAMNVFTANALLKILEEPPASTLFLLVSSEPKRLLPTIRSRCQEWHFPRPDQAAAGRWLSSHGIADGTALLALSGGMPLAALELAQGGGAAARQRFVADISALPRKPALRLAGEWEAWLKSKDAVASGMDMPTLMLWLQRWVSDLAALRLGGRVRFFPDCEKALVGLSSALSIHSAIGCYNELIKIRKVAQHPLNPRLMLEDVLLRYARALTTAR